MIARTVGRKGRPWYRVCQQVFDDPAETLCHLCGQQVDKALAGRTSLSRSVHHLVPPDVRPDLANVRSNLRLAHLGCNSAHGRGQYETRPGRRCTLSGCLVCAVVRGGGSPGAPGLRATGAYRGSRDW